MLPPEKIQMVFLLHLLRLLSQILICFFVISPVSDYLILIFRVTNVAVFAFTF